MRRSFSLRFLTCLVASFATAAVLDARAQSVADEPRVINPNGGWSWFGDERAVIDAQRGVLYVGSLANQRGAGGVDRDGDVDVTRVDLATGETTIDVLHHGLTSYGAGDDHNVASLLVLPNGRVLAAYTGHNNDARTFFRTFDPQSKSWDDERVFDWDAAIPGGSSFACTYNNLFLLPSDGAIVNISRNHNRCPNVIVSADGGQSWRYAGQLLSPAAVEGERGSYVNGYLKYAGRGDRIDLLATERHPRNYSNSLYHGYLEGGQLHRADGTVVDEQLDGDATATAVDLTPVFKSGAVVDGVTMNHAWMIDFESYPAGVLATVFKTRAAGSVEDHRFFYAAYRDGRWQAWPLAKAGPRLFDREEDYTGLAALDPNTPDTVYISTPINPESGETTPHHELYRGQSSDGGQTWQWRAVTQNSAADNFRPIIPRWQIGRTALLWNRGTMRSSQNYDQQVMLLIDPAGEE